VKRIELHSRPRAWILWTGTLREDAKAIWDGLTEMLPDDTPLDDGCSAHFNHIGLARSLRRNKRSYTADRIHSPCLETSDDGHQDFLNQALQSKLYGNMLPGDAVTLDDGTLKLRGKPVSKALVVNLKRLTLTSLCSILLRRKRS
jgi:hypothetical protein